MSQWIDYDLLKMEIGLHRSNAQREIVNYKEKHKPLPTSRSEYTTKDFIDRLIYENEVGREIALSCLEGWCDDFKFSDEEVTEIEEQKIREETVKKMVAWLEENIVKETEVIAGGPVSVRFNGLLEKFKKEAEEWAQTK